MSELNRRHRTYIQSTCLISLVVIFTMNSLTSICYVCLKTKDNSLININSSLSENKDILRIIGYLPCDLAWLTTQQIILICNECCLHLRKTDQFLTACNKNSSLLRGYMDKLNTAPASDAGLRADSNSDNGEIKLETTEETQDASVNVEECWVQTFSSIKIDDGQEESLIESGSGHQQHQGSEIVRARRKRTKADSSAHGDKDTSAGSGIAKKSKKNKPGPGNSDEDVEKSTDTDKEQQQQEVAVWCGYINCHTKTQPVYRGDWLCETHAPEQRACAYSTEGCTYRDFKYKCELHWNYFCPYISECYICGADVTDTTLDGHYTQAHGDSTYRAGTVCRVVDDIWSTIVVDCDFGRAVCRWWLCDDDYELWVITPLPSAQLCKYRCTVELSDPDTGHTLTYAPAVRYNSNEYDWRLIVPPSEYNACFYRSHLNIKLSITEIKDPLEYNV